MKHTVELTSANVLLTLGSSDQNAQTTPHPASLKWNVVTPMTVQFVDHVLKDLRATGASAKGMLVAKIPAILGSIVMTLTSTRSTGVVLVPRATEGMASIVFRQHANRDLPHVSK